MKLINKSDTPKPENTFSRSQLFTSDEEQPLKPKKQTKITTIRCTPMTSARLNAIVSVMGYECINELLDVLISDYENKMNDNEQREFEVVMSVYKRKNKL